MPRRILPFVTGEIYHIFNRTINKIPVFTKFRINQRLMISLSFYRFTNLSVSLSRFLTWDKDRQEEVLNSSEGGKKIRVNILGFCLMPNHYHLLCRQEQGGGISKFVSQLQNSFTRYYNLKRQKKGYLFEGQFRAVRIEDDQQLLHVSRYIHLNPYTSFVVKTFDELGNYPWSSLSEYLTARKGFCQTEIVAAFFKNPASYKRFLADQADYQRNLEKIKHLVVEGA